MPVDASAGIPCQYVNTKDGGRVYLLPGVPMNNDFEMPVERVDINRYEKALVGFMSEKPNCKPESIERMKKILRAYQGRVTSTASVLSWAVDKGRFDEFAKRLEDGIEQFSYIHPEMRLARTDMNSFFLQMQVELGMPNSQEIQESIDFTKKYGAGLLVYPKGRVPQGQG